MSVHTVGTFLNKLQNWWFCPPSDHLWTVSIVLSPRTNSGGDTQSTLGQLVSEIEKVNKTFNKMYSPKWKVEFENKKSNADSYLGMLNDPTIGMFLATDISFNANSVIIRDNQSNNSLQYTGFFSYAKTQTGRNHNHAIKIKFLKSNWDINDFFIDAWIAAIGQQGLIEDDSLPNIKADIYINEYAGSSPGREGTWFRRKQIKLTKAFPKARDQIEYTYSSDSAGEFKSKGVDFEFDGYEVTYFDIPAYSTSNERVEAKISINVPNKAEFKNKREAADTGMGKQWGAPGPTP